MLSAFQQQPNENDGTLASWQQQLALALRELTPIPNKTKWQRVFFFFTRETNLLRRT
jgi:hypothetical protein